MQALEQLLRRIVALDENAIINAILKKKEVQDYILSLNRWSQLYDEGIDSEGNKLRSQFAKFGRAYSDTTTIIKEKKGQPTDRVTLYDTGAFYRSFRVRIGSDEFEIEANSKKDSGDLIETWGPVLGLTDESLQFVINAIRDEMVPIIIGRLLR